MSCIETSVDPGRKLQNDGSILADRKFSEAPVFFVEGESMSLSETKWKFRQFLAALYSTDIEKSLAAGPEEGANVDVFACDQHGEADWKFGRFDRRSRFCQASICCDCRRLGKACSVVSEFFPSFVAD